MHCADDVRLVALSPPLAVKIVSPDILHKTEIGGVRLNVRTRAELEAAVAEVLDNAHSLAPGARIDGVIVRSGDAGFEIPQDLNEIVFGPVASRRGRHSRADVRDTACGSRISTNRRRDMLDEPVPRVSSTVTCGKNALRVVRWSERRRPVAPRWHNRERWRNSINPLFAFQRGGGGGRSDRRTMTPIR